MGQQHPWAGLIDTGVNAVLTPCQGKRQTTLQQKTSSYHQQDMNIHQPVLLAVANQIHLSNKKDHTRLVGYGGWVGKVWRQRTILQQQMTPNR